MTVKERLQEFLKQEKVSASEFARRMGLSPAYLASMRKSMPEEKIEKLMQVFPQLNRDWLLYGEGDMYREFENPEIDPYKLHRHLVPLVPIEAAAGSFDCYVQGVTASQCIKIYSPISDADIAIRVKGNSMEPRIQSGCYLVLKRINEAAFIPWGNPLVLDTSNGTLVKLLYPSEKGEEYLEARSYNKDYPPFQVPKETIIGIYRILAQISEADTF